MGWPLYSSLFLINIGISADLYLEISNLCSLHHSSVIWGVFCSVLNISGKEGPCILIIMSSAKTTFLKSGALESSAISSLMMMLHKVGPDTDPCGQRLVTCLELTELPNITWAARLFKKSLTVLKIFGGQFRFRSQASIQECQALSKATAMSSARRQHFCPICLL